MITPANSQNILKAAQLIQSGQVVAFPTETVYGLGANAYDSRAIAKIFAVKNRPTFNPLISHIADIDFLTEYAQTDERILALAKKFWPGPLTFILNRKDNNPALDLACAGLDKIAVRMPNHATALALIRASQCPIVAPSANKSQSISPTTAQHVYKSLGDLVPMILDDGPCSVGVESTILDMTHKQVVVLRAGGLSAETVEDFLDEKVLFSDGNPNKPSSPGQLLKHYAPKYSTRINVLNPEADEFFIGFGPMECDLNLSPSADLQEAAANLFLMMHQAENQNTKKKIAIAPIPDVDLGRAINDRIKRASYQ
jgi:L-threonylcarbamoyladenylate synthase